MRSVREVVIIVETECALFAAYYSGEVHEKGAMEEQAIIVSINNLKSYYLKDSKKEKKKIKGMTYDR